VSSRTVTERPLASGLRHAGCGCCCVLDALDPLEVERAALARSDLENVPGGGTAAVLRQLAERARGA